MGRSFFPLSVVVAVLSVSVALAKRTCSLHAQLAAVLSPEAELFVPSDSDYGNASIRWSNFDEPTFQAYPRLPCGHGWTSKLRGVQGGIGISTVKLNATEISEDGKTARLGGGIKSGAALKGAGQNFGIVTELTYKIYDAPAEDSWIVKTFIYSPDKIADFYTQMNDFTGNGTDWEAQPAGLLLASLYIMETSVNPDAPVLVLLMVYDGTEEGLESMAARFHAVGPVYNFTETVSYSETSPPRVRLSPIGTRALLCKLQNVLSDIVREAVPNTVSRLFSGIYWDAEHDAATKQAGEKVRSLLYNGTGSSDLNVYVGYANGDETAQQLFGSDRSKLEKLVQLKKRYDPLERFRFYAPLTQ
ncbi:FAD-binding domain containing protein [Grosmannia clavigera kw1407]|uniref:FAD-binding domain containing protein n=1 Tax=Grosmannia clavigera (strain kw1407 / UAMH 11150) TaxID=655863 RepID=F0XM25_GROCL|nr:FAD-binding domain containing protein [Grosmannia clavigera kw1407]EFX01497.1 FAD-binding domain containing protein [Grosmannia clavigera kw1407]